MYWELTHTARHLTKNLTTIQHKNEKFSKLSHTATHGFTKAAKHTGIQMEKYNENYIHEEESWTPNKEQNSSRIMRHYNNWRL